MLHDSRVLRVLHFSFELFEGHISQTEPSPSELNDRRKLVIGYIDKIANITLVHLFYPLQPFFSLVF